MQRGLCRSPLRLRPSVAPLSVSSPRIARPVYVLCIRCALAAADTFCLEPDTQRKKAEKGEERDEPRPRSRRRSSSPSSISPVPQKRQRARSAASVAPHDFAKTVKKKVGLSSHPLSLSLSLFLLSLSTKPTFPFSLSSAHVRSPEGAAAVRPVGRRAAQSRHL